MLVVGPVVGVGVAWWYRDLSRLCVGSGAGDGGRFAGLAVVTPAEVLPRRDGLYRKASEHLVGGSIRLVSRR